MQALGIEGRHQAHHVSIAGFCHERVDGTSKIQRVASSLTERDQLICVDLHEHRVLTTDQLFEFHFSSPQRARARLSQLHQMGVIWRNRPRTRLGSLPWHYTLDQVGAWLVAEHLGVELRAVGYRTT